MAGHGESVEFVIGVDGGGTHTECTVVGCDGRAWAISQAGPSNYRRVGLQTAVENIREATIRGMEASGVHPPATAGFFCIAGAGLVSDLVGERLAALNLAKETFVDHDAAAAWAGAHMLGAGLIVIAGTGAVAYGRRGNGGSVQVDGWGPLLGDEGSGFWIGMKALRAVTAAYDGRGQRTRLTEAVERELGIGAATDLLAEFPLNKMNSMKVAELAEVCGAAAAAGDPVSEGILHEAGAQLAQTAIAGIEQLGLEGEARVAICGGVLSNDMVRAAFEEQMRRRMPDVEITQPALPASAGAALLALRASGQEPDDETLARLKSTCRGPAAAGR